MTLLNQKALNRDYFLTSRNKVKLIVKHTHILLNKHSLVLLCEDCYLHVAQHKHLLYAFKLIYTVHLSYFIFITPTSALLQAFKLSLQHVSVHYLPSSGSVNSQVLKPSTISFRSFHRPYCVRY